MTLRNIGPGKEVGEVQDKTFKVKGGLWNPTNEVVGHRG